MQMVFDRRRIITELRGGDEGNRLKGRGFGIDLRASYPAIRKGLIGELTSEHPSCLDMKETMLMLRDTETWRAESAQEVGSSIAVVKRGVNAVIFGISTGAWKRMTGISDERRSLKIEWLERG